MPYFERRLPPELLHAVFDDLHPAESEWGASWPKAGEARRDLSTCMLVCRSWQPVAREHLFRDVVFSFRTILREPYEHLEWDGAAGGRWVEASTRHKGVITDQLPSKTLEMFFDFLQRSPAVQCSVRRLKLARYPLPWSDYYANEDWGDVNVAVLADLVASLPRLSTLHTCNLSLSEPRAVDDPRPAISVRNLHIDYHVYRTTVYNLLSWLGKVEQLTVGHSQLICGTPRDCPPSVSLDVHSFTISPGLNIPTLDTISELLSRSPHISNLRRVTVIGAPLSRDPDFRHVIQRFGPQLEYLKLVVSYQLERFSNQCFDLSRLSALKELVIGIRIPLGDSSDRYSFMLDHLRFFRTTVLSPHKNPRLKKLGFCLINAGTLPFLRRPVDSGWWEGMRSVIVDLETHLTRIVETFGFDGIHFEYYDENQPPDAEVLRLIIPQIFTNLARKNLIIT